MSLPNVGTIAHAWGFVAYLPEGGHRFVCPYCDHTEESESHKTTEDFHRSIGSHINDHKTPDGGYRTW